MRTIKVYTLLHCKAEGRKVSSRLLSRAIHKANLTPAVHALSIADLKVQLQEIYKQYYTIKKNHVAHRHTHLEELAQALAEENNNDKATTLLQLRVREQQRTVARKIHYLQGQLTRSSTTLVTVESPDGGLHDISKPREKEKAIMKNNEKKFQQSHHRPMYKPPLKYDLGFKGTSSSAAAVLAREYDLSETPQNKASLLAALQMPNAVRMLGPIQMPLSIEDYRSFWRTARENTSGFPDTLSFSTMKAGALHPLISTIECQLTQIPLKSGYSPFRWRKCMDVMLLKKSGITNLSSL
jgi:hypothetical protein